jgi:hypothetical protein
LQKNVQEEDDEERRMTIIKNKNNNIAFIGDYKQAKHFERAARGLGVTADDKTLAKAAQKFENGRLTQAEAQRLGLTITTR